MGRVCVPIYTRLYAQYRDDIISRRLKSGDLIHSIRQVQSLHGVSRETAKLVLKMLARDGLIVQRPGMGSFVAHFGPRKKVWAAVLPFYSTQYEELLGAIGRHAAAHGRTVSHFIDYNNWKEELRLVGELAAEGYEAIMIIPTMDESMTAGFYRTLSPADSVVTLLDHTMSGSFFSYVIQSYDLGVQRGVSWLLQNARGGIAFVRNNLWTGRNLLQELMVETFNQNTGLRGDRESFVVDAADACDRDFIERNRIGGLFCCDDVDAVRIIGGLAERGARVGDDLRLVSYGNTAVARYFTPALTSIDPHHEHMAELVTDIVLRRLEGADTRFEQYVVHPELVARST
jgi:DNA-binding LacI/PurR family transcriptional regulator